MSREINIQFILEMVLRRKWCLIVPVICCMLLSLLLVRTLPRFYESSSLILVHPSELSRDFVRGMVEYDVRTDLQNIEEQIYSRNWMERVVRDLNLMEEPLEGEEFDNLINRMLNRVNVDTSGRTSFTISFAGKDPQLVYVVVQSLTQLFIEENVAQMAKADADAAFDLDEEITAVEKELSANEENLAAYKQRHMGELPEQIEPNQRLLERMQVQQQLNGENLRDARNRQLILESQLLGLGETGPSMGDPLMESLLTARRTLEELRQQYTDNHPDVLNTVARIEILERELEERVARDSEVGGDDADPVESRTNVYNMALQSELDNVKMNISRLEAEETRLRQEISNIEGRVEAAFSRQQELTQLTRDYENMEDYYRTLLDSKLNTRLSRRVLRTHSANQYEVLDPPRVPRHPFSPDPIKILLLGIGCGLVVGGALAVGLEFRTDVFFSANALEESTDLPVLATIPVLEDKAIEHRRKRRLAMGGAALALLALGLVLVNLFLVDLVAALRDVFNSMIQ